MENLSDWGLASAPFDEIKSYVGGRDLISENEAQTRFDVIDRMIKNVLGWNHGQIKVEEHVEGKKQGYVDYILRAGDRVIVVEVKRAGAAFPSPTKCRKLKITGSILGEGEINKAIKQANEYAKDKEADVVVVTNGFCWCFYAFSNLTDDSYAGICFPFDNVTDAETLFNVFAEWMVERGSLETITNQLPRVEDRLLLTISDSDGRVDRNNIADHILPALNQALYADALLSNLESLRRCFVTSDARTKFDSYLEMHLSDPKPKSVQPAPRIKRGKEHDHLQKIVEASIPSHAPPVTLIIGSVGAGKSTYLKHFEKIAGAQSLTKKGAHWIYIDFEEMGRGGNPRNFMYQKLKGYLALEHSIPTDYKNAIEPAYAEEIAGLARGPLAPISHNRELFNEKVSEHILKDFQAVEPYVDKVFRFLSEKYLCVVVLDNIDLYEDEELEKSVFAEGLAFSKRIYCNVFVSIRDVTYVRHKTNSSFDAYELRKLWLDAPDFKAVLSARLTYSKKILENKFVRIDLHNRMQLEVPDLSAFFDIVQRSVLHGPTGDFIDYMADSNIRRGLNLITNFLTSGHIQADRALGKYIQGEKQYAFPFHEIFKGTMLGQWKYYKEGRAECLNLFDSRLGSKQLRLLRLHLLSMLLSRARAESSLEVPVQDCVKTLSHCGASESQIIGCLQLLNRNAFVRTSVGGPIDSQSSVVLTRTGGYQVSVLTKTLQYIESCMLDTAIEDRDAWIGLQELTASIERSRQVFPRMELRGKRLVIFMKYLSELEESVMSGSKEMTALGAISEIRKGAMLEFERALMRSKAYDKPVS